MIDMRWLKVVELQWPEVGEIAMLSQSNPGMQALNFVRSITVRA
jgi:hypothetical protein